MKKYVEMLEKTFYVLLEEKKALEAKVAVLDSAIAEQTLVLERLELELRIFHSGQKDGDRTFGQDPVSDLGVLFLDDAAPTHALDGLDGR